MGVTHTLLPPRGKAGSGPSDSGGHFDPKMFAQLLQEEKGENGLRNEPDSSRNEALERGQQEGGKSVCACHWLSQQHNPGSSTDEQVWVSTGRTHIVDCRAGAATSWPPQCTQVSAPCANPCAPHISAGTCTAVWELDGCNRATAVVPGPRLSPIEARACNTSGPSLGWADKGLMQEAAGLPQLSLEGPLPQDCSGPQPLLLAWASLPHPMHPQPGTL